MRKLLLAALIAVSPIAAQAQDALQTSTAPAPTQVRLPLVRSVADGSRIVLQIVGATDVNNGAADMLYVGTTGYVATASEATDIRGPAGGSTTSTPVPGPMGAPGKSAYDLWLEAGNSGTASDFLASLRGAQGVPGVGSTGSAGANGKSAYQVWLDAGNTGTEAQFLASLRGSDGSAGSNGIDGAPAQLRVQGGFIQWSNGGAWQDLISTSALVGAKGDRGDAGPQGIAGNDGQGASIAINAVTTGAPGTNAIVQNIGTPTAASLNFTIPRGDKGEVGQTGSQGPIGLTGQTGPKGDTGSVGPQGASGTAATVSVGTVTTLAAGATPTVTNGGTSSAAVLNFGLPRGAVFLNDVTLTQTAVVAIALGPRTLTVSTNCLVGDRLFMSPAAAMPAGYQLGDIFCSANGTAQATLYGPLLAIGASYSIGVRVTAFR